MILIMSSRHDCWAQDGTVGESGSAAAVQGTS